MADGVGSSGITTKLTRLQQGLDYHIIDYELDVAEDARYRKAEVAKTAIRNWKSTLSREVHKNRAVKLEMLSEEGPFFDSISSFTENEELRTHYQETIKDIQEGIVEVPQDHLSQCTAWLAGRKLYYNAQRPGAVVNFTVSEAREAKTTRHQGRG